MKPECNGLYLLDYIKGWDFFCLCNLLEESFSFISYSSLLLIQINKEDMQMTRFEVCSTSYFRREMQIKITRYHYTPTKMPKIQNTEKHHMMMKMLNNRSSHSWLVAMWDDSAILEASLFLNKTKNSFTIQSNNHTPCHLLKWIINYVKTKGCTQIFITVLFTIART